MPAKRSRWPTASTILAVLVEATSQPKPKGRHFHISIGFAAGHVRLVSERTWNSLAARRTMRSRFLASSSLVFFALAPPASAALEPCETVRRCGNKASTVANVHATLSCQPRCGLERNGCLNRTTHLDPLLVLRTLHHAVHKGTRHVDVVRIQCAHRHDLLHLASAAHTVQAGLLPLLAGLTTAHGVEVRW